MGKEIWKPIPEYETLYEASTKGNIRSISRNVNSGKFKIFRHGRILKKILHKVGYHHLDLCKDEKKKKRYVHRLVAITFIENPENKRTVNHINGIKTDNRVENLQWCTHSENTIHAYKTGLLKK